MAQAWESPEIKAQGDIWAKANEKYNQYSQYNTDLAKKMAAAKKAEMDAASAKTTDLRAALGYSTDASGLNQKALSGYIADPTNTKFTPAQPADVNNNAIDWNKILSEYQPTAVTDNSAQIKAQYQGDLDKNIALLKQAVANSKAKLQSQQSGVKQQANDLRSQIYTNSRLSAIGNNEKLANQGLSGAIAAGPQSGVSESSRIAQDTAMGNDINAASRNEQTQLNDIASAILEQDRQQNYGIQTLTAENASNLAQALINESNRVTEQTNQNKQTSLSNLIAALGAKDSLANNATNRAATEAGLTGYYNGQQTQASKQQALDNLYRQQTFDYQKSRDTVSDAQWQKSLDLDLRKQSFAEAQQKIENALSQKRISQEDASQALQWAKFNADKDQQSLDNQDKQYKTYLQMGIDRINAGTTDGGKFTPRYTNDDVLNWIKGLNITSQQKANLANDLGL